MLIQEFVTSHQVLIMLGVVVFFTFSGFGIHYLFFVAPTKRFFSDVEGIAPPFITLPAIIFSLTAALMASSLWENYSNASKAVRNEVNCLLIIRQNSEDLPESYREKFLELISRYAESVINDEWASMVANRPSARAIRGFNDLERTIFSLESDQRVPSFLKSTLLSDFQNFQKFRLERLGYRSFDVSTMRVISILILAMITQFGVGVIHMHRSKAHSIMLTITTLCLLVPLCTIVNMIASPFSGFFHITSEPFCQFLR